LKFEFLFFHHMSRLGNSLESSVGQEITVRGWLHNKRSSGSIAFLEIRDGYSTQDGMGG
jgi:asparaginyl-tRNA synthetase